eukprot:6252342-Pyramimonas_sp.AAC.1
MPCAEWYTSVEGLLGRRLRGLLRTANRGVHRTIGGDAVGPRVRMTDVKQRASRSTPRCSNQASRDLVSVHNLGGRPLTWNEPRCTSDDQRRRRTSPGVDCRPANWQSVSREYTSNIR